MSENELPDKTMNFQPPPLHAFYVYLMESIKVYHARHPSKGGWVTTVTGLSSAMVPGDPTYLTSYMKWTLGCSGTIDGVAGRMTFENKRLARGDVLSFLTHAVGALYRCTKCLKTTTTELVTPSGCATHRNKVVKLCVPCWHIEPLDQVPRRVVDHIRRTLASRSTARPPWLNPKCTTMTQRRKGLRVQFYIEGGGGGRKRAMKTTG